MAVKLIALDVLLKNPLIPFPAEGLLLPLLPSLVHC